MSKPVDTSCKPISMWGYFGYQLLFAIPFIGIVCLIVCALSAKNINLRNFARSYFCVVILVMILFAIMFACGGVAALLGFLESVSAVLL